MDVRFRPISSFPFPPGGRKRSLFQSGWSGTLELLNRELKQLRARNVVIELALTESDIRIDGWPRANARTADPRVVISFDSKHGPLRYGTDAFDDWQDNVRAIALGLEALRKVERYGIGKRGEQYVGWRALPAAVEGDASRGRELIEKYGGEKAALKAVHPDHGGDPHDFADVQAARRYQI